MRKLLISAIAIVINAVAFPQQLRTEDLQKYSYLICAIRGANKSTSAEPIGTGFFIKYNGVLFFGTAKHILTKISPFDLKPITATESYDTIAIRYLNEKN